jgi:gentisate 1,2-dioxygenase
MQSGDLLLTPPHFWHEHRHDGPDPMTWMDILDHPISVPMEVSYLVEKDDPNSGYVNPNNMPDASEVTYTMAGLVPYRSPSVVPQRYPLMRFEWKKTREALLGTASFAAADEPVHMMFINPQSGASLLETMCFSVRMLRPGEEIALPRRSASTILHVLEGAGETEADGTAFGWDRNDTIAVPTFSTIRHRNGSSKQPAFLLQIDDSPMQYKLGFYEDESVRPFGASK